MIYLNNKFTGTQGYPNWRYNNTVYMRIPITYQSVVSAVTRVFAWICG